MRGSCARSPLDLTVRMKSPCPYLGNEGCRSTVIVERPRSTRARLARATRTSSVLTQRLFLYVSELQVRVDGVNATSRHRDAVDVAVRASTRLVNVQSGFVTTSFNAGDAVRHAPTPLALLLAELPALDVVVVSWLRAGGGRRLRRVPLRAERVEGDPSGSGPRGTDA